MKIFMLFSAVFILFAMCCFNGCVSTGAVPEAVGLAGEYRDIEREVQSSQAELAITGERIGEGSRDIAEGLAPWKHPLPPPQRAGTGNGF
jgi:hypothetical protein